MVTLPSTSVVMGVASSGLLHSDGSSNGGAAEAEAAAAAVGAAEATGSSAVIESR